MTKYATKGNLYVPYTQTPSAITSICNQRKEQQNIRYPQEYSLLTSTDSRLLQACKPIKYTKNPIEMTKIFNIFERVKTGNEMKKKNFLYFKLNL